MKVLIYEPNKFLQKFLSEQMLKARLTPLVVDRESLLLPTLATQEYEIFLTDYTVHTEFITDVIFNLRLDEKLHFIKVFITMQKPERSELTTLINLGIIGFAKKPFTVGQFDSVFQTWIARNNFSMNRRDHARVTPNPTDNAFAFFLLPHLSELISGAIGDISAGGFSVVLPKNLIEFNFGRYKIGTLLPPIRISLRRAMVQVNAVLINISGNRVSFKFSNLDQNTLQYILRYVSDRIEV